MADIMKVGGPAEEGRVMADIMKVGGPAFPITTEGGMGGSTHYFGMSLRDWFAGQALIGMLASRVNYPFLGTGWNAMAAEAYEAAAAMLARRSGEGSP